MNRESIFIAISRRDNCCRVVFSAILCSLIYGYYSHVMVHQMQAPVLSYLYLDPSFWILHVSGIMKVIVSTYPLALALDIMLFSNCILAIVMPSKRIFPFLFFLFYFLYFIIFNTYGAHHTLNKTGILLMPLAFIVSRERFAFLWEGLRYYTMFIFASAFTWKLFRLSWLAQSQGELILKKNQVAFMYHHPDDFLTRVYFRLLDHPAMIQDFFIAGFLLEGCFIIGFFTRRYDRLLFGAMVLLIGGFWFFADAFFGELLIFGVTLLPLKFLFFRRNQHNGPIIP